MPRGYRKTNVFGIFTADKQCFTEFSAHNINGEFVVAAIERFCGRLSTNKPSVLVLDNAAMHHSLLVRAKLAEWQGLIPVLLAKVFAALEFSRNVLAQGEVRMAQAVGLHFVRAVQAKGDGHFCKHRDEIQNQFQRAEMSQ